MKSQSGLEVNSLNSSSSLSIYIVYNSGQVGIKYGMKTSLPSTRPPYIKILWSPFFPPGCVR